MKKNYQVFCILSICSLFLFYKYLSQLFPNLISGILIEQFNLNGIQIGILASSYYYSYSIMQIFAGIMLDKYSVKTSAFLAILITSLAIFGFTHTDNFIFMCAFRILMGIGCSFATTLYLKCAATYTSQRAFGLVSSLLATATMLGAAAGIAPVAMFFEKIGWQHGLDYIAFGGFILSILSLVIIKFAKAFPETNAINISKIKEVVFNSSNISLLLYSGITFSPIIIIGGLWGIPFLELKFHVTTNSAATLISVMFIGLAIGSPIWALINGYIHNRKSLMYIANTLAFFVINLILFAPINFIEAAILFFCFGFAVGCFMLSFVICREINGVALMGIAVAFINSGEGLIGIVLEPGIGLALDLLNASEGSTFSLSSYQLSLSILPLCYVLSSLLVHQLPQKNLKIKYEPNIASVMG